jgi:hypothetical protein
MSFCLVGSGQRHNIHLSARPLPNFAHTFHRIQAPSTEIVTMASEPITVKITSAVSRMLLYAQSALSTQAE